MYKSIDKYSPQIARSHSKNYTQQLKIEQMINIFIFCVKMQTPKQQSKCDQLKIKQRQTSIDKAME